ncbi:hypothetical protein [Clavibacter sp. VKM Ac-2872]|uniref:hypothetical protein n=1 Tax=Clavibacter sp. VKM Ac-2872 TaxID=2783812 RepID=UPI001E6192B4|nr:hypothetical protein [Clavibacter sp. VKM Ac-2872]
MATAGGSGSDGDEDPRLPPDRDPGRFLWPTAAWSWALQFAVLDPLLAVLLVALYGATPAQVGVVLGVYNAGGFVASLEIPTLADRRGDYLRPLVLCAITGSAWWSSSR